MLRIPCDCGARLKLKPEYFGRAVSCSKCQKVMRAISAGGDPGDFPCRLTIEAGPERAGEQFLLGGDTGLRGYDNRRFDGNKRLLLNVEDRAYMVFDWLHLVSIAFSAFTDAGYVWRAGESEDLGDLVGDVGIGFRFDFTRGSSGTVVRLDYGYPVSAVGRADNPRGLLSFTAGPAF